MRRARRCRRALVWEEEKTQDKNCSSSRGRSGDIRNMSRKHSSTSAEWSCSDSQERLAREQQIASTLFSAEKKDGWQAHAPEDLLACLCQWRGGDLAARHP